MKESNVLERFFFKFYNKLKKIISIKKPYPLFKDDIELILKNIGIYSDIAKKNKIKIFNLSKKSNLNRVKNITFLKKYNS